MSKNKDTYKNSTLDRAKPKHGFHAFINKTLKRHRADTTGLVEDSTSSSTVVRIIIGLILVHLIVIGGVLLRGHIVKNDTAVAAAGLTSPTNTEEESPLPEADKQTSATKSSTGNHITQAGDDMVAEEVAEEPAPAAPKTPSVKVKHHVVSGESLNKIATQYNVTVGDIVAANPGYSKNSKLKAGVYLTIPVAANSDAAKKAGQSAIPTAPAAKTHVVKKGETLSTIAKKYRTPTYNLTAAKLMKLNNMTEQDARHIKIGTVLIVSE